MVIHRLPQRRDGEVSFRDMQAQLTEVGRIRIGIFNPDKGKKGAPAGMLVFDVELIRIES